MTSSRWEKASFQSEEIFEDTFEFPMVYHYSMERHEIFGGAYGSKSGANIEPLVAVMLCKAQRSVRVIQNVSEGMTTCRLHSAFCKPLAYYVREVATCGIRNRR